MTKTVADQGLSVDEYKSIVEVVQNDPEVPEGVSTHPRGSAVRAVPTRYCPKDDPEGATPHRDFRLFAAGAGAATATGGGWT